MDPASCNNSSSVRSCRRWALASMLLVALTITSRSIWIDEAVVATYASQESLDGLLRKLLSDNRSEAQMPLGMTLPFFWARIFGNSEYALRLPNLFWLCLGIIAFASLGRRMAIPWLPFLLAVHPVVWYYADEARPYAMQIGLSGVLLWATAALLLDDRISTKSLLVWWLAGLGLCASSLMAAIIYAVWLTCTLARGGRKILRLSVGQRVLTGGIILMLALLAAYFVWTVGKGVGPVRLWDIGIANPAFVLFEFGGFMGFAPGRNLLRDAGREGLAAVFLTLKAYVIFIGALASVYVLIITGSWRRIGPGPRRELTYFCVLTFLTAFSLVLILCLSIGFSFWGRHLVPLLPLSCFALAVGLESASKRYRRALLVAWLALLLSSSLIQRFHPTHRKDDYRSAVTLAREAEGKGQTLLWVASLEAAEYYNYRPARHYINYPRDRELVLFDMVIYSKPDIFDPRGRVAALLEEQGYWAARSLPAFTIWRRNPPDDCGAARPPPGEDPASRSVPR